MEIFLPLLPEPWVYRQRQPSCLSSFAYLLICFYLTGWSPRPPDPQQALLKASSEPHKPPLSQACAKCKTERMFVTEQKTTSLPWPLVPPLGKGTVLQECLPLSRNPQRAQLTVKDLTEDSKLEDTGWTSLPLAPINHQGHFCPKDLASDCAVHSLAPPHHSGPC